VRLTANLGQAVHRRLGLGRRPRPLAKLDRQLTRPTTALVLRLPRRVRRALRRYETLRVTYRAVLPEPGRPPKTLTATARLKR